MTGDALAELSNNLLYSAMVVYAVAMYCYTAELAFGSPRRRQGGRAAGARARGRRLDTGVRRRERERAPACAAGADASDDAREARASRLGRVAVSLTVLAFALHLGSIVARGVSAGRPPWGNMFEFSVTGALAVTGVFLLLLTRKDVRYLGTFVVLPVLLTLGSRGRGALHRVGAAGAGAEVGLAGHPRHGGDHRLGHPHHRVRPVDLLPGAGEARAGARPSRVSRRSWTGCPRPRCSTGRRTRCTPSPTRSGPSP